MIVEWTRLEWKVLPGWKFQDHITCLWDYEETCLTRAEMYVEGNNLM